MATVRDLLARKGSAVFTIAPGQTVLEAAQLMNEQGIGGLLVMDGADLVGVFTERDVLRRVVAVLLGPAATPVKAVMTRDVITCSPDTSLEECRAVMTAKRVRHLPVLAGGEVRGIITIGDLLAMEVAEHRDTIDHLQSYVFDVRQV
jgi:CBS domain-containing protein